MSKLGKVISFIAIILVTTSFLTLIIGYYNEKHRSCISEPLVYAAQKYEQTYGYPFIGSGRFLMDNPRIQSATLHFNSKEVTQELNLSGMRTPFNFTQINLSKYRS